MRFLLGILFLASSACAQWVEYGIAYGCPLAPNQSLQGLYTGVLHQPGVWYTEDLTPMGLPAGTRAVNLCGIEIITSGSEIYQYGLTLHVRTYGDTVERAYLGQAVAFPGEGNRTGPVNVVVPVTDGRFQWKFTKPGSPNAYPLGSAAGHNFVVSHFYGPPGLNLTPGPRSSISKLTAPAAGSVIRGGRATFEWTPGAGIVEYWCQVGTAPGIWNLKDSSDGLRHSTTLSGLPTSGTLYVRHWSKSGVWGWAANQVDYVNFVDYAFQAEP